MVYNFRGRPASQKYFNGNNSPNYGVISICEFEWEAVNFCLKVLARLRVCGTAASLCAISSHDLFLFVWFDDHDVHVSQISSVSSLSLGSPFQQLFSWKWRRTGVPSLGTRDTAWSGPLMVSLQTTHTYTHTHTHTHTHTNTHQDTVICDLCKPTY